MTSVFLGIKRRKFNKKDVHKYTSLLRFHRFNISLASCSAAELVSVSVEHCKNQSSKLYLQTVKKVNHVQSRPCLCGFGEKKGECGGESGLRFWAFGDFQCDE